MAVPVTDSLDGTPVQLHEVLHERQADARSAVRWGGPASDLREQIIDVRQHLLGGTDTAIPHAHDDFLVVALNTEPDPPTGTWRKFGSIVEQVGEDLHETRWVGLQLNAAGRKYHI